MYYALYYFSTVFENVATSKSFEWRRIRNILFQLSDEDLVTERGIDIHNS